MIDDALDNDSLTEVMTIHVQPHRFLAQVIGIALRLGFRRIDTVARLALVALASSACFPYLDLFSCVLAVRTAHIHLSSLPYTTFSPTPI